MTKDKQRQLPVIAAWAVIITAAGLLGLLAFFLFFHDNPPVEIYNEPLPITPAIAAAGETVEMTNSFCRHTDAVSDFTAYWRRDDGLIWAMTQRKARAAPAGVCDSLTIGLKLPDDLPAGRWQRVNIASYQVNPLANHTVDWESEFIEVRR